jgi:rare lipoprotein A
LVVLQSGLEHWLADPGHSRHGKYGPNMSTSLQVKIALGIFLVLGLAGCAERRPAPPAPAPVPGALVRTQRPYQINGIWYYPLPTAEGYEERGKASWYGADFHARPTAQGEPYNMYAMTAAHKVLPIGTHVKVTHPQNGRSIIVRINDRGPFVAGRVIDLSYAAADALGMAKTGVATVQLEAVQVAAEQHSGAKTYWLAEPVPSLRYGNFAIQIGAFQEPQNAYRLAEKMSPRYLPGKSCSVRQAVGPYYRVQVGAYRDLVVARQEMERLKQQGFADAFVVAMEE